MHHVRERARSSPDSQMRCHARSARKSRDQARQRSGTLRYVRPVGEICMPFDGRLRTRRALPEPPVMRQHHEGRGHIQQPRGCPTPSACAPASGGCRNGSNIDLPYRRLCDLTFSECRAIDIVKLRELWYLGIFGCVPVLTWTLAVSR